MMCKVLADIPGIETVMVDILVHTTVAEHCDILRRLLQHLYDYNMTVNPSKVALTRTNLLSHIMGNGKCECQVEKIEKIRNAPWPTSVKQVRSFVRLVGYYRAFIPDLPAPVYSNEEREENQLLLGAE